jgi:transposase
MSPRSSTRPSKGSHGVGRRRADRDALEKRRLQAARLFVKGMRPAEVARQLGVSRQSASVWHQAWEEEGVRGLKQAERAGRPPFLTVRELKGVQRALLKGPGAYGWSTQLWTLERVADVIAMETGVRYHVGHVWKILRRLGWSWQKPARRATERDEEAISRWVREEWPEIKKSPAGSRLGSSSRMRAEPR